MFSCLLLYYFRLLSGYATDAETFADVMQSVIFSPISTRRPNWIDRRRSSARIYGVTNFIGFVIVLGLSGMNAYGASNQISTGFYDANNKTQDLTSFCSSVRFPVPTEKWISCGLQVIVVYFLRKN